MDLNTQFVFEGKLKRNLFIGMAVGVLCLALSFFDNDSTHMRFWSNYLHNTVFFSGIAFTIMFFLAANIVAYAGWMVAFKRVWEAMGQFMWVGAVLLVLLVAGVWLHWHHLYHWNTPGITDPNNKAMYDEIIAGKAGFLNPVFFTVGTIGFMALWFFIGKKIREASLAQDSSETADFTYYKKQRFWASVYLPVAGFMSTVFLWQTMMSIDSHWYSTMYAWYSTISVLVAGLSLTVMLILYLKSKGYMAYVNRDHLHDLGKYIFGLSVFWAYLWFDQFMLIWYANVGEETIYFKERMDHYPVLFWGNLLINFIAPFLILMRNDTKRKFGTMFFVAALLFFGHWWDYFYMIKPGARIAAYEHVHHGGGDHGMHQDAATIHGNEAHAKQPAEEHAAGDHGDAAAAGHDAAGHGDGHDGEAGHPTGFELGYTVPGFLEIGTMIGFLSLFLFFFYNQLQGAPLIPARDPYLEETMHHSTGVYLEEEMEEEGAHSHH